LTLDKIISKIHKSDLYGIFVEMGAGVPVANELFKVPGASSTIHKTLSPYSKQAQLELGQHADTRSISLSSTSSILSKFMLEEFSNKSKVNFILVSSFQIGKDIINHGWISVYYNNKLYYYHLTLPEYTSRTQAIQIIGESQIKLIYNLVFKQNLPIIGLDICLDNYNQLLHAGNDSIVVFNPDNKPERLETSFRDVGNKMILFKGSFNPLHEAHLEMMEIVSNKYKNTPKAFCITLSNYEDYKNKLLTNENLLNRIKSINNLGYYVILMNTPLFKDSIKKLNDRLGIKIILPMGYDTYVRCNIKDFEGLNYKLHVFDRDKSLHDKHIDDEHIEFIQYDNSISSTKLRN
jgi:hypothetical protein